MMVAVFHRRHSIPTTYILWDGEKCGLTSTCCEFNNPPRFCKELDTICSQVPHEPTAVAVETI